MKAVADQEEGGVGSFGTRSAFFVGAFGHWWAWEEGVVDDQAAVKDRLASSVMAMESLDAKPHEAGKLLALAGLMRIDTVHGIGNISPTYSDDKEDTLLPGDIRSPATSPKRAMRPIKAEFRAGQRRASPILRRDKSGPSAAAELQAKLEPLAEARLAAALAEKKLASSQTQHTSPQNQDLHVPKPDTLAEPVVDEAILSLQKQLEDAKSASTEIQAKLNAELEELRQQKKEDDRIRSEAKARTRVLEEAKRLAEVDRAEADKKRTTARQSRQAMTDHIERMKTELSRLERKEADQERKLLKTREDCTVKTARIQEDLARKREDMALAEASLRKVTSQVENLEQAIEARKAEIDRKRQQVGTMLTQQRSISNPAYYGTTEAPYQQWISSNDSIYTVGQHAGLPPGMADQHGYALTKSETLPIKTSFLEHRLWHQREHLNPLDSLYPSSMPQSRFASAENLNDHSNFAPFGPQIPINRDNLLPEVESPENGAARKLALPFFMHGSLTSLTGEMSPEGIQGGHALSDPGPLSPMTPHQASLLPSHLFNLLDEDEEDDVATDVLSSPTRGLELFDVPTSRRSSADNHFSTLPDSPPSSRSPSAQNLAAMSNIAAEWHNIPDGRLSLNPGAKAFNFTMPSQAEAATEKRNGFGLGEGTTLRDVWNRATASSKKTARTGSSSFSPFEDDLLA